MSRLNINTTVAVEADDDILDSLEDMDPTLIVDIDMDAQLGDVHPNILAKNRIPKNTRRRLEDKIEDLKLERQITDYGFILH